ncbi:MAG: hypothetical protein IPM39_21965 [Chloroflexi bacterium]|nr:hypothetical protein [Chloroflexota bacterium]
MNGERETNLVQNRASGKTTGLRLLLLFGLVMLALWWAAPQMAYTAATPGNGPGGVGLTDGSSTLELWLRADKGVFANDDCTGTATNGNPAGCWQDQSGNGANATQGDSVKRPTLNTGALNSQPLLYFNAAEVDALVSGSITLDEFTVFSVFDRTGDGFIYEQGQSTSSADGSNLYSAGTECTTYIRRNSTTSGLALNPGWMDTTTAIVTHAYAGTHASHTVSKNNALQSASGCIYSGNSSMDIKDVPASIFIGARNGDGFAYTGNLAELIFYSEDLPAVQKILVENYLSSKYGIALAGNDYYDGDTPANGNFDLDVAGIGQFGSVLHTEAQAAGMVIVNGTFLNADGDWLLFGHNVPQNSNTISDLPVAAPWDTASDPARWLRSFHFTRTDAGTAGGTVTLSFDFSNAGMSGTPGTAANYRLLSRPNATGAFSDITLTCTGGASVSGDRVTFSSVNVTCLGSNFTLGTLDRQGSPTAVSLNPLAATPQVNGLVIIAACVLTLGIGSLWVCVRHRPE